MTQIVGYLGDCFSGDEAAGSGAVVQHGDRPSLVALLELGKRGLISAGDDGIDEVYTSVASRALKNFDDLGALGRSQSSECCGCAYHGTELFFG